MRGAKWEPLSPILTEREKILLLFMAALPEELTPIRIMKGMFVINERKHDQLPKGAHYKFIPYLFGPFTSEIYRDLESLERQGLLKSWSLPGMIWRFYKPTELGRRYARKLANAFPKELVAYIEKVREWATRTPLSDMLRAIYAKFPQYANQSIARIE